MSFADSSNLKVDACQETRSVGEGRDIRPKDTSQEWMGKTSRTLPIEVWERVIDHLWRERSWLKACALVCRSWHARAQFHLISTIELWDSADVLRLATIAHLPSYSAQVVPVLEVRIAGGTLRNHPRPVPHLGTFAAMLAGRLTRVKTLEMANAQWLTGSMQPKVFIHLSAFTSITQLILRDVLFPTVQIFGRLVCALRSLDHLFCRNLSFSVGGFDAHRFHTPHRLAQLARLDLDESGISEVIDFLVATALATTVKEIWIGFRAPIRVRDVEALSIHRLLKSASTSLRLLDITLMGAVPNFKPGSELQDIGLVMDDALPARGPAVDRVPYLDLKHNTSLEELCLRSRVHGDDSYTWMHTSLAAIPPTHRRLRKLVMLFDIRGEHVLGGVIGSLQPLCAPLDKMLSSAPQFCNLESVDLQLWDTAGVNMASARVWSKKVARRLPKLRERDVLL